MTARSADRPRQPLLPSAREIGAHSPRSTSFTLDLLRSDLSHETSAKFARLAGILAEWERGSRRAEDAEDIRVLLDEVRDLLLRHSRIAMARFSTVRLFLTCLLHIQALRSRAAKAFHATARQHLAAANRSLARLRNRCRMLVEALCAQYGTRVGDLVADAADTVRRETSLDRALEQVPVILEGDGGPGDGWIPLVDASSWSDVLRNLIRNAVEATRERPGTPLSCPPVRVRVSPRPNAPGMRIEILDVGIGMTAETLDAMWKTGSSRHVQGRGRGLTEAKRHFLETHAGMEIKSVPGIGTHVRIDLSAAAIPIPRPPIWAIRPAVATTLVVIGLLAAGGLLLSPAPLVAVEMSGTSILRGRDSRGGLLWEKDFEEEIQANDLAREDKRPDDERLDNKFLVLRDLKGQAAGVVLATLPLQGSGMLWDLNSRGRTQWSRPIRWQTPRESSLGRLRAIWETCVPWEEPYGRAIAVHVRDNRYSPSSTQFWSVNGDSLGAYYHWGHLRFHSASDLDGDGRTEILLFGVANHAQHDPSVIARDPEVYLDCAVLLEVPKVSGQAYPYQDWPGMEPASEEAYLLIPPFVPGVRGRIYEIVVGRSTANGPLPIEIVVDDGRIYHVDTTLRPISCATGDNTIARKRAPGRALAPLTYFHQGKREAIDIEVM